MTTNKSRIAKLEKVQQAKDPNNKIWVMIFGADGRVEYGSDELIGMTREEVTAYTGNDNVKVVRLGIDLDRM